MTEAGAAGQLYAINCPGNEALRRCSLLKGDWEGRMAAFLSGGEKLKVLSYLWARAGFELPHQGARISTF